MHDEVLKATAAIFIMSLKNGSSVAIRDPEDEDLFHGAWVTKVKRNGFSYEFKNKHNEGGFARFKDCLSSWKPPSHAC